MKDRFDPVIDGHADTLVRLTEEGGSLKKALHLHIDLPRLKGAGVRLQVFAVCAAERNNPYSWTRGVIRRWQQEYETHQAELVWIKSATDFKTWAAGEKVGVILALEGLEPLAGDLTRLGEFYEQGVRMLSLTWNGANPFACGVGVPEDTGLTALGKALVEVVEEKGMILDLSHLGQRSFIDLMDIAQQPVCVSHANAYSVHPHRRNLTTEQIKLVAASGGTVGLTFYPPFIGPKSVERRDLIPHLEAIIEAGGENCPALGSDFDGIDLTPTDLLDVSGIPDFLKHLAAAGFSQQVVARVAGGNLFRFFAGKFAVMN
jgi:membrane dipeptidase